MSTSARKRIIGALAIVVGTICAVAPARGQSIESLLDRLERKYDTIESLRADFTQTVKSAFDDMESTSSGELLLAGEKYRFESGSDIVATDGTTSWTWVGSEKTFFISDVDTGEGAFSPGDFFTDFEDNFDATLAGRQTVDGASHFVIDLSPKSPDSFFIDASVWMRERDDLITQMRLIDVNEGTVFYRMTNIVMNPPVEPGVFKLEPPEGAEIVDLRER